MYCAHNDTQTEWQTLSHILYLQALIGMINDAGCQARVIYTFRKEAFFVLGVMTDMETREYVVALYVLISMKFINILAEHTIYLSCGR